MADPNPSPPPRNMQSGAPVAETSFDDPRPVRADAREGVHFEPDPDQGVRVVHQVRPQTLPVDSPTDYERQGGSEDTSTTDVRVTPTAGSVREARPADDGEGPA